MTLSPKQRSLLVVVLILSLSAFLLFTKFPDYTARMNMQTASVGSVPESGIAGDDGFGVASVGMMAARDVALEQKIMPPIIEPVPGYGAGSSPELVPSERMIIKTADVSMIVKDVGSAIDAVAVYAKAHGGYEVTRSIYKTLGQSGSITIRVPSRIFDEALRETQKLGELQHQQVSGQDITEEFVDVAAQLKNLRATEDQFLDIMKRAQKIEDVLSVQRELTTVRSQIERLEGRKKYLEQQSSMSTITINFSTDPRELPVVDSNKTVWRPLAVAKDAIRGLMNVSIGVANVIIQVIVFIPFFAVLGGVFWLVYRGLRRLLLRQK